MRRTYSRFILGKLDWNHGITGAIMNAFILYRGWSRATEISIKQFRIQLAKELIGGYCSRYRVGYNGSLIKPLPFSHFPMKITATSPRQRNRGRCTYCYQQKKRCDSQWYCHECGIWLCHPGSGTAMSVAYGCATLEMKQRIASYCGTKKYFSSIGTIRWCIISPTM